jgi:hypothetical protein
MLKKIALAFAMLTLPLTTVYADPAKECVNGTVEQVLALPNLPSYIRIEGASLEDFKARYADKFQSEAPDVDLILIFKMDPQQWVIVDFKDGCNVNVVPVPPRTLVPLIGEEANIGNGA